MHSVSRTITGSIERWCSRNSFRILISLLVVAISLLLLWPRIVVTIRPGEAGVLFKRFTGTHMEQVYGEGLKLLFPWDIMYVYNVRLQTVERDFHLLTNTGLPVDIRVAVRYQPDPRLLPFLHTTVGPEYVEKVVIPETEAVLRRFVGQYDPEEIYTTKRGLLDSILMNSLSKAQARFITIDDVLIKAVNLPPSVQQAIEEKLVYQQHEKAYAFRIAIESQEAERKRIEALGIRDYQKTIRETLDDRLLRWQGIQATRELATSNNAKTVVVGGGKDGLPLILGGDR
jgi:regulator of protease activity HflC (stomatin/prohibitin superfamily)